MKQIAEQAQCFMKEVLKPMDQNVPSYKIAMITQDILELNSKLSAALKESDLTDEYNKLKAFDKAINQMNIDAVKKNREWYKNNK